jgi:hypothetical protein
MLECRGRAILVPPSRCIRLSVKPPCYSDQLTVAERQSSVLPAGVGAFSRTTDLNRKTWREDPVPRTNWLAALSARMTDSIAVVAFTSLAEEGVRGCVWSIHIQKPIVSCRLVSYLSIQTPTSLRRNTRQVDSSRVWSYIRRGLSREPAAV